jgi:hypothetical protein
MNPSGQLNIDGLDDDLIADVRAAASYLSSLGALTIISDEARTRALFGEFAAAGINLFDQYTRCQNIFQCRDATFLQLKHQKIFKTAKGEVTVLNDYDVFTLGYKESRYNIQKLTIEPCTSALPAVSRLLGHLFGSDDVPIHGHSDIDHKYQVRASDKAIAGMILSDPLLNAFSGMDNMHLTILQNKAFVLCDGISVDAARVIASVLDCL